MGCEVINQVMCRANRIMQRKPKTGGKQLMMRAGMGSGYRMDAQRHPSAEFEGRLRMGLSKNAL